MAAKQSTVRYTPNYDTGLGVVMRLNLLWSKADWRALDGDFEGWNYTLDRIYCNLLYRQEMKVEFDENNELSIVGLDEVQARIHEFFKQRLKDVKLRYVLAIKNKNRQEKTAAREEHYRILMQKDIWLRKFMMDLGLYLKEQEYDPSMALWGGG